ncbi:hypothetical protein CLAIMM_02662 [Cladophialophora immunda]|nr:hypothetical protein CLAIMM_02662 [Cladophialophora immunda]
MGSVANTDVTLPDAVVPKRESSGERYSSSSASTPEAADDAGGDEGHSSKEPAPAPKRKGGRKPIYATSEERKQRNRQAQAAFRERRTEYIKQLESTIQHHEETLQNLQQSHRAAADECLMLRYKNSLLERILLEKGIDVQAELALKGSFANAKGHAQQTASKASNHDGTPNSDSHSSFTALLTFHSKIAWFCFASSCRPEPYLHRIAARFLRSLGTKDIPSSFQKHYTQLEQEYDAQASIMDDLDGDDVDTDSFIPNFRLPPTTTTAGMSMGMQASPPTTTSAASDGGGGGGGGGIVIDPYDPMLDADPFGLTASMHFPTLIPIRLHTPEGENVGLLSRKKPFLIAISA